jgi:hypothetical protein
MSIQYIQVGVTAARDPKTGACLPTVPIYREAQNEQQTAEILPFDVGKLFAEKMRQYIEGTDNL